MKKIFLDKEGLKRYTDNMKTYIAKHGGDAASGCGIESLC